MPQATNAITDNGIPFRLRPLSWVLDVVPYSKQSIYRLMSINKFPRAIRLGGNRVAWKESDILAWIASKEQASA